MGMPEPRFGPRRGLPARIPWAAVLLALLATPACRRQRFPSRGDAPPVVVVAPRHDAAPPPRVAEREPNDALEQAQAVTLGRDAVLIGVEGSLPEKGPGGRPDVDLFKLTVPGEREALDRPAEAIDSGSAPEDVRTKARRLSLELVPAGCAGLGLELLDEAGQTLVSTNVDSAAAGGLPNLAVLPGYSYFVRVKRAGKPAKPAKETGADCRYTLTGELGEFQVADEREPNGEMATANPVELLGTSELAGYHGWPHDRDFYRIPAPEVASALDLQLQAVEGVGASLEVLDGAGVRLAFGKGHRGERLALRNVILQPAPADGAAASRQAFVMVRGEVGENRSQPYVLRLSLGARKLDAEVEPNDSPEKATAVKDGVYSGYLPAGDVDYFRYEGAGSRSVTFAVTFSRRVRGRIQILGSSSPGAHAAEARKPRQLLVLTDVAAPQQALYLRVSSRKGDGNANEPYSLNVSSTPTPADRAPPSAPPTLAPAAKP